jgi:GTPase SAR1 family protein
LNPEWVTLGIYALFDDEALVKRGGVLSRPEMATILNKRGYPVEHERIIEEVMRRFDLLYDSSEHGDEHRMLIPLMLPEKEPKIDWPEQTTLKFVYQYEVMPAGLVPAFIARMHKSISKTIPAFREDKQVDPVWRYGCVLDIKNCHVRVIGDREARRILISVAGTEPLQREALDQVRFTFDSLHNAVEKLPVKELIPVPGHPEAEMLDYAHLRSLEWNMIREFPAPGASFGEIITVEVREALDGVRGTARKERDAQQGKTVHVHPGGIYNDRSTNVGRDVKGSQVGQNIEKSTNQRSTAEKSTPGHTDGEEG